ncbi:AEC family transporter [Metamycoplasma hyosynoviae]|uniref:Malate permease n=1 Tax=Metamycoplasma hyosynoviae TaxID=29559 RepID=A0A4P1QFS2_9BACT|nr:AEC family transporter [Metamycoplasma hyosynoviae]ASI53729.1 malate permease [Metamycoplasma hyosynoviae]MDC8911501.1 malate permease [Metamycoplasma hyosynoviae]MDC8921593.1 malate permease [Metamycoplasma hyosynoviae]MDD1359148.1 malate permease [Metamycoplasma hyosynoviae]MDD1365908.1 malate permease [Metamycoplasma hyosynoviae]
MKSNPLDLFKGVITHTGIWGTIIATLVITILGFVLFKTKFINESFVSNLEKVVINILLPFLAFYSFLNDAGKRDIKTYGIVFGASAFYYFFLTAIAILWVKLLPKALPQKVKIRAEKEYEIYVENYQLETGKVLEQSNFLEFLQKKHLVNWLMCIYGSNILFATPVIMALYPTGSQLGALSIWNILYYIGGFGLSFSLLSGIRFTKKEFKFTMKKAFLNASFIVVMISILLWSTQYIPGAGSTVKDLSVLEKFNYEYVNENGQTIVKELVAIKKATFGPNFSTLYGIRVDDVIKWFTQDSITKNYVAYNGQPTGWYNLSVTMPYFFKPIQMLTNLVSPLIWIVIGTSLAKSNLKEVFSKGRNWLFLVFKMILIPLFIMAIVVPLVATNVLDKSIAALLIMTGSVPPGTTIVIYSQHLKVHEKYTAQVSSLSTISSFIFIPMWLAIGTIVVNSI